MILSIILYDNFIKRTYDKYEKHYLCKISKIERYWSFPYEYILSNFLKRWENCIINEFVRFRKLSGIEFFILNSFKGVFQIGDRILS